MDTTEKGGGEPSKHTRKGFTEVTPRLRERSWLMNPILKYVQEAVRPPETETQIVEIRQRGPVVIRRKLGSPDQEKRLWADGHAIAVSHLIEAVEALLAHTDFGAEPGALRSVLDALTDLIGRFRVWPKGRPPPKRQELLRAKPPERFRGYATLADDAGAPADRLRTAVADCVGLLRSHSLLKVSKLGAPYREESAAVQSERRARSVGSWYASQRSFGATTVGEEVKRCFNAGWDVFFPEGVWKVELPVAVAERLGVARMARKTAMKDFDEKAGVADALADLLSRGGPADADGVISVQTDEGQVRFHMTESVWDIDLGETGKRTLPEEVPQRTADDRPLLADPRNKRTSELVSALGAAIGPDGARLARRGSGNLRRGKSRKGRETGLRRPKKDG